MTDFSSSTTANREPSSNTQIAPLLSILGENAEGRAHIDSIMDSELALAFPESKRESLKNSLWAIGLEGTDDTSIDAACNSSSRIASRFLSTAKRFAADAPPNAEQREGVHASSADDLAPAAKRPRSDGGSRASISDENSNPERGSPRKHGRQRYRNASGQGQSSFYTLP